MRGQGWEVRGEDGGGGGAASAAFSITNLPPKKSEDLLVNCLLVFM